MITISDFIKNSKIDAKLLYGLNGSKKIISSVTIEDIPEVLDVSTRGQLIISGRLLKDTLTLGWIDKAIKLGVVGIVSKIDLASQEQIDDAVELLELAGCERIFLTSAVTGEGTQELLSFLEDFDEDKILI